MQPRRERSPKASFPDDRRRRCFFVKTHQGPQGPSGVQPGGQVSGIFDHHAGDVCVSADGRIPPAGGGERGVCGQRRKPPHHHHHPARQPRHDHRRGRGRPGAGRGHLQRDLLPRREPELRRAVPGADPEHRGDGRDHRAKRQRAGRGFRHRARPGDERVDLQLRQRGERIGPADPRKPVAQQQLHDQHEPERLSHGGKLPKPAQEAIQDRKHEGGGRRPQGRQLRPHDLR